MINDCSVLLLRYEYEYRVCAENEAGEGQFSKVVGPVAARDRYGKLFLPIFRTVFTVDDAILSFFFTFWQL